MDSKNSILVIGAGMAGLACASELLSLNLKVDIVEAKSTYGGRIHSYTNFSEKWIELGAEEVHSQKTPLFKVFKAHGAKYDDLNQYEEVFYDRQLKKMVNEDVFHNKYKKQLEVYDILEELNDSQISLYQFLQKYDYTSLGHYYEAFFGAEYGSCTKKLGAQGIGECEKLFPETCTFGIKNLTLLDLLFKVFGNAISLIKYNTIVTQIKVSSQSVEVQFNDAISNYDYVVCTIPLTQIQKIQWSPPLSAEKQQIIQNTIRMEKGGKLFLKLNIQLVSQDVSSIIIDTIPSVFFWNNSNQKEFMIIGLISGQAYEMIQNSGIQQYLLLIEKNLQDQINKNVKVIDYFFKDWGCEEYIEGLYTSPGVGYKSSHRSILSKDIEGRVYFCGEAYHKFHFATIHGAYETGIQVANQIKNILKYVQIK